MTRSTNAMKRALLAVSMALAVLTAFPAASRAGDVEEAKRLFEAASQAYVAGQFATAATVFEEAYRLAARPAIRFSLAQAYRKQYFVDHDAAKLQKAAEHYRAYLAEVPEGGRRMDAIQALAEIEPILASLSNAQQGGSGSEDAPKKAELTQLLISSRAKGALASVDGSEPAGMPLLKELKAGKHKVRVEAAGYFPAEIEAIAVEGRLVVTEVTLRERPAWLTLRGPAEAEISIDGRPVGKGRVTQLEVPAGRHFIAVTRRGHRPFTREVGMNRGETTNFSAELEPTTQRRAAFWVAGGSGVFLLCGLATTVMAVIEQNRALDAQPDASTPATPRDEDAAAYARHRDRRDTYRIASAVLYGGAVAAGVTAALLYYVDDPRVERPSTGPTWTVVPEVSTEGISAVLNTSF